jgi:Ca2+-binding EF-hand superfamily protein
MTFKTLIAAAVAAAFALPFSASAAGDKADKAASSSDKSAASGATKSDGGAEAMFKALDKNNDGFMSKEEVKGTPHDKDFSKLDKNNDGKLSREEHAAAPEHSGKAGSGASAAESKKPESTSKPKY